jgi:hypothetical protein
MKTANYEAFEKMSADDRRDIFSIVADKRGVLPAYAEKDFWACRVLNVLMRERPYMPKCYFKGGTSLSKGFGLIDRFSEDIDVIFDRAHLGFARNADPTDLTKHMGSNARKAAIGKVVEKAAHYSRNGLCGKLRKYMPTCAISVEGERPEQVCVLVEYNSVFEPDPYVANRVKVEGGARGALMPSTLCTVTPYVQEQFPDKFDLKLERVTVIEPRRTFLEKLCAIHSFNHKRAADLAAGKPMDANRVSRHFYDVAQLADTEHGSEAMADAELLANVVAHSKCMFPGTASRYDLAVPKTIKLVPDANIRKMLEDDYAAMRGMMYGTPPTFQAIMAKVAFVEGEIRKLAPPELTTGPSAEALAGE